MTFTRSLILSTTLILLCGCTIFDSKKPEHESGALPAGKNWQIIEEPPKLSDESGRLPFQKEQSVQSEGAKPPSPAENRTIKTPQ